MNTNLNPSSNTGGALTAHNQSINHTDFQRVINGPLTNIDRTDGNSVILALKHKDSNS